MSGARRYFGTDGIRGPVGAPPLTAEFALRLGAAAGRVLGHDAGRPVVIGTDTRRSCAMFSSALEAGLTASGTDVVLLGVVPTPAIAVLTRELGAAAGVVISASHNPHEDNGIKFFDAAGSKLSDETELAIESLLCQASACVTAEHIGRISRLEDAGERYVRHCRAGFGDGPDLRGLRLVVDCAHGATHDVAPRLLRALGADVVCIGAEPDGRNINDGVGAVHPAAMCAAVKAHHADAGLAFDGDGDRLMMADRDGTLVDGDEILFVIARERSRRGRPESLVVGTQMTNLGLEEALTGIGARLERAQVGDRYVMERMRALGAGLGGETSGHVICLDKNSTGDGLVCALEVLDALVASGVGLREARDGMYKYPQVLVNVRMSERVEVSAIPGVSAAVSEVEAELGTQGRVLLRLSGTEPLVRVMVEGREAAQTRRLAERIADCVRGALGAR